jgi:hypothetical protein
MSPIKRIEKKPLEKTRRVWNPPAKGYGASTPATPAANPPPSAAASSGGDKVSKKRKLWNLTKKAAKSYSPKGFSEGEIKKFTGAILILLVTAYFLRGYTLIVWILALLIIIIFLSFLGKFIYSFLPESVAGILVWLSKATAVIVVLYFGFTFASAAVESGGIDFLWAKADEAGLEKGVKTNTAKMWDRLTNPTKIFYDYYNWGEPESVEKEEKRGIEFFGLGTRGRDYFDEGSTIIVQGSARIDALENEDTSVSFECGIDKLNKSGNLVLLGMEGNSFDVYAGNDETIDFECRIDGVEFTKGQKSKKPGEEKMRTFVVDVKGIYKNYENKGVLKIYNLRSEDLKKLRNPKDEIKDPYFSKTSGKMESQCLSGCGLTRVALKTSAQPQTNVGTYSLGVGIAKDKDYYGDVYHLNSVEVLMPDNFELIACDGLGGDNVLEEGDPLFYDLNKRMKKEYGLTSDYSFYCDYRIVRPYVERVDASEVLVITNYDYMVDTKKIVNVKQQRADYVPSGGSSSGGEDDEYGDYDVVEGVYTYT